MYSRQGDHYDIIIIGAGVTGTALAWKLAIFDNNLSICVLERERAPAMHTSGRNSGVLHPGYHLKPGTLKARLCRRGNELMREFCSMNGIRHRQTGTLVTAVDEQECAAIDKLFNMGSENGVPGLKVLEQEELRKEEPRAKGIRALLAPTGTVVDSVGIVRKLCELARARGVSFRFNHKVTAVRQKNGGFTVETDNSVYSCGRLVNCAGLWADQIAHMLGVARNLRIFPFRGEYYILRNSNDWLGRMVYPVPNLEFPFLGIHFTPTVDGEIIVGPNAVLSFGRGSYSLFSDMNLIDTYDMIVSRHFSRMVMNGLFLPYAARFALTSLSKRAFAGEGSRLVDISHDQLERGRPPGNRAQLVDDKGRLIEDMLVIAKDGAVHILNVVSPGFTCSLAFAEYLIERYFDGILSGAKSRQMAETFLGQ